MNGYKEMVLRHSAKGNKWKNHKYTSVIIGKNGKKRYVYDTKKQGQKISSDVTDDDNARLEKYAKLNDASNTYTDRYGHDINHYNRMTSKLPNYGGNYHYMKAQTAIGKQSSKRAVDNRKASHKAKIKYYAAVNKAKKYAKKGKEAVKKFIDKNIKKTFTVNKNQIILPDSGARVTFK